jgi:molecular chaperone DnaJ
MPDPRFVRHGADLVHQVRLGIAAAAAAPRPVPTVDGDEESISIPAGTQPGTVFRLSKRGMPRLRSRGRGDLLVEVIVEVPSSLDKAQQAALRAFAATLDGVVAPTTGKRKRR